MIGHADRVGPLRDYCTGLLLPGERKSVEPMAAQTAPARTAAQHQSLLHFVGQRAVVGREGAGQGARDGAAVDRDGTGRSRRGSSTTPAFPSKGKHSVGVHAQYCGQLGKQDNCQVAVSLSIANHSASLPVAYRLYLPKEWAKDRSAAEEGGRAEGHPLQDQAGDRARADPRGACEAGLPRGVVLMDAAYGVDSRLRTGITALGVSYVVGIQPNILMWRPGTGPRRKGRPLNNTGRRDEPDLISAKTPGTRSAQ